MDSSQQPWKKRMTLPDPQVRSAAEQFDDARKLLDQQPPGSGVLLPLLNNAAIAIELFLKSLTSELIYSPVKSDEVSKVKVKPMVQNHQLIKQLEKVPEDLRKQLENSFLAESNGRITLKETLGIYEGLFQASRYPFEPNINISKFQIEPLMHLSNFLREFVTNLKPFDLIEW